MKVHGLRFLQNWSAKQCPTFFEKSSCFVPSNAWHSSFAVVSKCLLRSVGLPLAALLNPIGATAGPGQFVVFNVNARSLPVAFVQINREFTVSKTAPVAVGVATIFSYFQQSREKTVGNLKNFLQLAQATETPVVVQFDGENWWNARPDLWNWWDPAKPGFSPSNRVNVEWTGWSPDNAIKIAWRNWGRQMRVPPPPNLMSPAYRTACHEEMRVLIPLVMNWWQALPADKKFLLIGIKLGWESSIGANAWYYPNGNALLDRPENEDPTNGLTATEPPARGVAQIGFAAVKSAGLRSEGAITEADLAEVVRRHLEDLCQLAADLGVPRDKLFTHVAGWRENEMLYQSGLNRFSCPGWSFYRHADDPRKDAGVQAALARSDAPYWAAVEWLFQGPRQTGPWRQSLANTLAQPRCRYLCIYNWQGVRDSKEILQAVHQIVQTASSSRGQ